MAESMSQERIVAFLSDPANWPEEVREIAHVQTHISHLFLGRALALKMKKAVKLPYLDFSTLALRARYCRRELEVNAAFSPELYLGLSRVARMQGGALMLDPPDNAGETVEWLVRMRRFKEADILARRFRADDIPPGLPAALARVVCAAHRKAEVRQVARPQEMFARVLDEQIAPSFAAHEGILRDFRPDALLRSLRAFFAARARRLKARARAGFVRRCHGDLHLGNIVLVDGAPRLFDAIEFDEDLATIDVLYDLAFLLMDMVHRGHKPRANEVMNTWLALCDDERHHESVDLLAPMMALRALIRAMVELDLADQLPPEEAAPRHERARAYLRSARIMLEPAEPLLVAVGGLSGSGKTTLARRLAGALAPAAGAVHLRSDVERKVMAGVQELTTRLPEEAYTPAMSAKVYARLNARAAAVLRAGWPVVVDAVFGREEERQAIEEVARAAGARFIGLWLDAPLEVLMERVRARSGDASDATEEVVRLQARFTAGKKVGWAKVAADGGAEDTWLRALRLLTRAHANLA